MTYSVTIESNGTTTVRTPAGELVCSIAGHSRPRVKGHALTCEAGKARRGFVPLTDAGWNVGTCVAAHYPAALEAARAAHAE